MADSVSQLVEPSYVDDENQRIGRLLNFFSVYITLFAVISGGIRFLSGEARVPFLVAGLVILSVGVGQFLIYRNRVSQAGVVLTTAVWLSLAFGVIINGGVFAPVFSLMMVVIVIASLVISRRAGIVLAIMSMAVGLLAVVGMGTGFVSSTPPLPITVWSITSIVGFIGTAVILYLAVGDLDHGLLQLRQSNNQLVNARQLLESYAASRANDMKLASEIGRRLAQIQDLDELLNEAVRLVCNHFNLYHVQIFLLDKSARTLVLQASTGSSGTELLHQGHRLPLGAGSVNGTAAAQQETIIISEVQGSRLFRANPLLPETRSEMAVPLLLGSQLLGVLDLQSRLLADPIIEKVDLFELLASQLAVAIQNSQLFAKTIEVQQLRQAENKQTIYQGWVDYLDAIERDEYQGYEYDEGNLHKLVQPLDLYKGDGLTLPLTVASQQVGVVQVDKDGYETWVRKDIELVEAISQQIMSRLENIRLLAQAERFHAEAKQANERLAHEAWRNYQNQSNRLGYAFNQTRVNELAQIPANLDTKVAVSAPVTVQGTRIGFIEVGAEELANYHGNDDETAELVEVIATQLSTHIENLRLTQQTEQALADSQARAKDLLFVNRIVSTIAASLDLDSSLQFIADELVQMLGIAQVRIALLDDYEEFLYVVTERHDPSRTPSALGAKIPIANSPATAIALAKRETVVVKEPQTSVLTQSVHKLMREQSIETLVIIPLVVGKQVLGTVGLDILEKGISFSEEQIQLAETVVFQAAAALQSSRSFEKTEQALAATEALYEGSDRIIKAERVEDVLVALLKSPSLQDLRRAGLAFFDNASVNRELPETLKTAVTWEFTSPTDWTAGLNTKPRSFHVDDFPAFRALSDRYTPAIVTDLLTDERIDERSRQLFVDEYGMRGFMHFPLIVGDLWIGMFAGLTPEPLLVSDESLRQIAALVDQAAVVLQNKLLFDNTENALKQAEQQAQRLAVLNELSGVLSTTDTLNSAFVATASYASQIFHEVQLSIALLADSRKTFQLVSLPSGNRIVRSEASFPLLDTAVAEVMDNNEVLLIDDVRYSHFSEVKTMGQQGVRSVILAPMTAPDGVLGVLAIGSRQPKAFDQTDRTIVAQIASLLAATIENRRLLTEARRQADRERIVNTINQKIQSTTTMETAMRTAVQELGQALRARYTEIRLEQPNGSGTDEELSEDGKH